ncbi:MAG: hypothetical protein KKB79_01130 [Nanoarchaeota archaeon]|nr:hypothetical protein [Nanoarchaeota archaeon]
MVKQIILRDDFPEIVTLSGSTRFKDQFLEVQRELGLEGKIVISVSVFGHADNLQLTEEQKVELDELHLRKIDLADTVYIIDVGGSIGESTRREIAYAKTHNKKIKYYSLETKCK